MLTPDDAWFSRLDKALRDRLGADARAWLDEALAEATAHATARGAAHATAHGTAHTTARGTVHATPRGTAPATGTGAAPQRAADTVSSQAHADTVPGPTPAAPPAWETRFAAAGRHCLRSEPPHHADPEAAEAARVLILCAARADDTTVTRLYEYGTAAERRAVLLALPQLPLGPDGRDGLPLIEDALRTNDTRLVAAAVGPYAARHLDAHAWRHAVLKCLFTGVSVDAIAGLAERSRGDAELARMLGDYARERTSAGRPVPDDLPRVLALTQRFPLSADTPIGSSADPSVDPSAEPPVGSSAIPAVDSPAGLSDGPSTGSSEGMPTAPATAAAAGPSSDAPPGQSTAPAAGQSTDVPAGQPTTASVSPSEGPSAEEA